ncbi:MAG: hypothetical protein ACE149_08150 [Armatimonadota bacterium]
MPFCPNCRTEYSTGESCADCGARLVAAPPEGWSAGQRPEQMRPVEVAQTDSMVALDLMESQLRAAGIPTARRVRRAALFVAEANLEAARRVLEGKAGGGALQETFGLSELHRIRLVCAECEQATTVDLLADRLPDRCRCGRYFDLGEARPVIERYTEIMRTMDEADFEIEVEAPQAEG